MQRKSIYILTSLIIFLVIVEILTSVIFYFKDNQQTLLRVKHITDAPYLYYKFSENTNSFNNKKYLNPDGFACDVQVAKDTSAYRVILLGGSVAEGLGRITDSLSGKHMLEDAINIALKTKNIELLNAGISGYTIEQEFILYQLYLRKYNADLVIDLSGYNDVMSFKLNRNYMADEVVPPQHYREAMTVDDGKRKSSFWWRFTSLFRGTTRAVNFIGNMLMRKNQYDYSEVTTGQMDSVAAFYLKTSSDIKTLANASGSNYFLFLQPVRWYDNGKPGFKRNDKAEEKLCALYKKFEDGVNTSGYGKSLTSLMDNNIGDYRDDCHQNYSGKKMFCKTLADEIAAIIKGDTLQAAKFTSDWCDDIETDR